ncbi:hypothetical protein JOM56_005455 [Amanita muscaria]
MHYPAALQPQNHDHRSYFHPDVDINTVSQPNTNEYDKNLRIVLGAATATAYKERCLETGISRPSICLGLQATMTLAIPACFPIDLMHLCSINIPQHLLAIWRNAGESRIRFDIKPDFIILDQNEIWKSHGELVASMRPYLPTSFDQPPRNPALKINSGFKACEYLLYFWALGPVVFRPLLPHYLLQPMYRQHYTKAKQTRTKFKCDTDVDIIPT